VAFPESVPDSLTDAYGIDTARVAQWNAFLKTVGDVNVPASLSEAIDRIRKFLLPVISGKLCTGIRWSASDGDWVRQEATL